MVDEQVLDQIRQKMKSVKVPGHYDKVYKDECMFSYATSESKGGLYINMTTHQSFSDDYVDLDFKRNGNALYLHETAYRVR